MDNQFDQLENQIIELDKDSSKEDSSEISMEIIEKVAPQRHNQFNYDRLTKVSNAGPAVDISPKPFKLIEL